MKNIPQGGVVVLVERIQVASQAPSEHHRLLIEEDGINDPCNIASEDLWYDGDLCSEVLEAQLESVNAINDNPAGWFGQSEKGRYNT